MFYTKMFQFIKKILKFVCICEIRVGCHPSDVPSPVIIFFPLTPGQLNCGFAGLVTCRLENERSEIRADQEIASAWITIKKSGLRLMGFSQNSARLCWGGLETLHVAESAVFALKREDAQEALFFSEERTAALSGIVSEMNAFLANEEKFLEEQSAGIVSAELEIVNSRILLLKDICWMLDKDILSNFQKITALAGAASPAEIEKSAFRKYRKLNLLLNALDRLEVRGRDSAGVQIAFSLREKKDLHEILRGFAESGLSDEYESRARHGDLLDLSICVTDKPESSSDGVTVSFTYKTFSIVGELGRNVAELRRSIARDRIFQSFAAAKTICETALTHTRWASVGAITEANCHPVNNYATSQTFGAYPHYPESRALISVVLNGDIDNYARLRQALETDACQISPQVTTDTKIIPLQIEKYLKEGEDLGGAFRLAVNDFEGSHAIAMHSNLEPGKMFLALKGSGQSIYVGVSSDQYMFSSELYGLVEVMPRFIKMNGETANGTVAGQIFVLDQNQGAGLSGLSASFYDGTPFCLSEASVQTAEITTRDIDRSNHPHFFLKEISESALSVRRTLRGKYRLTRKPGAPVSVAFNLGTDIVPALVREGLENGRIKNIVVIGHGTAAVAGAAVADAMAYYLGGQPIHIASRIASELSGFGLKDDLTDTLIIPITQSGTTTDTNRAVAMARERGALIVSIVNRRQSDITTKSHGVFYTSDGRDIEMSVASTKAFYAQIIAGQVLALFFAQLLKARADEDIAAALGHLESAPRLMEKLFAKRNVIAESVRDVVSRRYWAIVGSGPNKAAADEIRIKLSELCYRTISSDIVENKKHIDLSAEPLILVCASGNPPSVTEDVVKDVAIFKAHKSAVVVFADEDDARFDGVADSVIAIPAAPEPLPVILNTMAGHLWGYYAARAIDDEARSFREFRGLLADALSRREEKKESILETIKDIALHRIIGDFYETFNTKRRQGAMGSLSGKIVADLLLLLKYAAGKLPLHDMRRDFLNEELLVSPFELLDTTLGLAIDELSRPIDAIRHQAKTVTVGTSRKEKELEGIIFDLLESLRFSLKNLTYRNLLTISRIQPAIAEVKGYTLYDINGLDDLGNPTEDTMIVIARKHGVAAAMKSRADRPVALMGTKRTIVSTGHAHIGKGKTDGAPIVVLPLLGENNLVDNLLLIHIAYNEALSVGARKDALGYRYNDIRNLVNECNLSWRDDYLESFSLEALFSEPIEVLAAKIQGGQINV